jgi:threonine/homoserine/homoserine lactone efflux protein
VAFAGLVAVVVAIPGPSVLFTVSRAVSAGRRTALFNVAGNAGGLALQVVAVSFGLGAAVERSSQAYTAVKLAGAIYLIFLGARAVRHRGSLSVAVARPPGLLQPSRAVRDGAIVGATNPKTMAVMVATLPQFAVATSAHLASQFLVLGMLFPALALVFDSLWALAAGTAREWFARSRRRMAAVGLAGGLALIGVGITVAAAGRKQ